MVMAREIWAALALALVACGGGVEDVSPFGTGADEARDGGIDRVEDRTDIRKPGDSGSPDGDGGAPCVPGHQSDCPCSEGASGWQVCADDGSRYSECECRSWPESGPVDEYDDPPPVDSGPDAPLKDAGPDAFDEGDSGPTGPPYDNQNVRCRIEDAGDGYPYEFRCEGLYAMNWGMRYQGSDSKWHTCTGSPDDSQTYRPPCPEGNECTVYKQSDALYGTCVE